MSTERRLLISSNKCNIVIKSETEYKDDNISSAQVHFESHISHCTQINKLNGYQNEKVILSRDRFL